MLGTNKVVVVVVEWFTTREFWLLLPFFMFHTWKKVQTKGKSI